MKGEEKEAAKGEEKTHHEEKNEEKEEKEQLLSRRLVNAKAGQLLEGMRIKGRSVVVRVRPRNEDEDSSVRFHSF